MAAPLRRFAARFWWPALALAGFGETFAGLRAGIPGEAVVAIVYLTLAAALALLERASPHEPSWNESDGELGHDLVLTLFGSGATGAIAQAALVACLAGSAARLAQQIGHPLWPSAWPLALQVVSTVVLADLGAYWAHRLCHERPWLWRFHSIHHSVRRLWWLNTGRIHPIDVAVTFALSTPILILLGAPADMMVWLASTTTIVGLLSHCNVELETRGFNRLFNTPGVHRWHHSRDRRESDRNFGENTMLWDLVFGTYFLPAARPPREIGTETRVPASIGGQLLMPLPGRGPGASPA